MTDFSTGRPHKRWVWLFVWNIKKCMEEYWRVLYLKLISRNGQGKAQNKCKPTSIVVCCRFCGSTWRIWAIWWVLRWLLLYVTYSNSQRKTHKIAQIRHVEPQKRQHRTIEVGLHLFWALTWPFLDISLRYKTLQYSSIHFFIFQTNNQTRRLCAPPVVFMEVDL